MSNLTDSQKETENTKLEVRSGDVTIATSSFYLMQVLYEYVVLCGIMHGLPTQVVLLAARVQV